MIRLFVALLLFLPQFTEASENAFLQTSSESGSYNSENQLNTHVNLLTLNKDLKRTIYVLSGFSALLLGLAIYLGLRLRKNKVVVVKELGGQQDSSALQLAQEEIQNLQLALQKERSMLVKHEVKMRELQAYIEELKAMQASTEIKHKTIEIQQKFSGQKSEDLVNKLEETAKSLHPELVAQLKMRFPDINALEFQYCMMLVLGYNSDDIMATLNRSEKAIKSLRYRIRKKMGLEEKEGLREFIMDLSAGVATNSSAADSELDA